MTTVKVNHTVRGVERATKGDSDRSLQRITVISASGTRSEMLPADPRETARILKERRNKTPAARALAKMAAAARKRGL